MKKLLVLIVFALFGCGDGVPTVTSSDSATRCRVEMRGDSITYQAGQVIEQFLPGCEVVNLGVHASILADVVQPIMVFDKNTIYTYSYGVKLRLLLPALAVLLLQGCASVSKPQTEQVVVKIKTELPAKPLRLTPKPPEPYSLTAQKNISQWQKQLTPSAETPAK